MSQSSPPNPSLNASRRRPLTIRSMLVLTAVFATTAASAAHLWRAAQGDTDEIGRFVIVTAMSPLLLMVAAYWILRISKHFR